VKKWDENGLKGGILVLKIGVFSILSKISIHMLRHYDEIDLLKPAEVDQFTNYRYYSENQLPIANRIQALKDMGFGLTLIKEIISKCDSDLKLKEYLIEQANQQRKEIIAIQQRLLLTENTINSLNSKTVLPQCNIIKKEIPARMVVSHRGKIQQRSREGVLWEKLAQETTKQNVQFAFPPYHIALFHDEEYKENDVDVEVQRAVTNKYHTTESMTFKKADKIMVAAFIYKGRYDLLKEATGQLVNWIADNGYEITGNMFNVYHISPETERNPENMITEICFPIK